MSEPYREDKQPILKPFEEWLKEHKVAAFLVAAARRKFKWPKGREMTLESFLNAIEATKQHHTRKR